jgi:L-arabinose transport system substrate-binding protein
MSRSGRRSRLWLVMGAVLALAAAACGDDDDDATGDEPPVEEGDADDGDEAVRVFYIRKQGGEPYFVGQAEGADEKAAELGLELTQVDVGTDPVKAVDEVDSAINQGADGIIIVVPDPSIGPDVVTATAAAGIPLLTSDDQICTTNPDPTACDEADLVPRVGFSPSQMGEQVGQQVADFYAEAGWPEGETGVIAGTDPDVTVCVDRTEAAKDTFAEVSGTDIQIFDIGTTNEIEDSQTKAAGVITANPDVQHWIAIGCNDANVIGEVNALEDAGFGPDDVIGVGINGDDACNIWRAGAETGVKASLWLAGGEVGSLSVENMFNNITEGTEFEPEAFAEMHMLTPDNFGSEGEGCGG